MPMAIALLVVCCQCSKGVLQFEREKIQLKAAGNCARRLFGARGSHVRVHISGRNIERSIARDDLERIVAECGLGRVVAGRKQPNRDPGGK